MQAESRPFQSRLRKFSVKIDKTTALKTLPEAGIKPAVMGAPLFPRISDWKALIELTRPYTDRYGFDSLNMRPAYQRKVLGFVAQHYPQWVPLYSEVYVQEEPSDSWHQLGEEIQAYCTQENIRAEIYFGSSRSYSGG